MRQFYYQIGTPLTDPIFLYCDNESAIAIAKGKGTHSKSKAIRIETHTIRDRIRRHEIEVENVSSKTNIADILTKSLPHDLFVSHRDKLGFEGSFNPSASSFTQGDISSDISHYDDATLF
jgi:ATP sulfurylase